MTEFLKLTNTLTNDKKQSFYASNSIQLSKKNITIDQNLIERYPFLSPFLHYNILFFEDIYFSILYIQENSYQKINKKNIIIYNFIIDKLNKKYCKNNMIYEEFKDSLLNLNFSNMKKSFIYSKLHLSGYEYDLNHDINEWLNQVKYIDTIYHYHYGSKIIEIDKDYTF
jgi:hypothetical protein